MKIQSICVIFLLILTSLSNDQILSNQFYTNQFTDTDFSRWTMSGSSIPSSHFFTQCGIQRIFGGYKVFGGDPLQPSKISRQYTGLIAHYGIRIRATIYKIDSWNTERIYVMVDNRAQKIYTFDYTNSTTNICGDPYPVINTINRNYNDSIINLDINISHTSSQFDISFETDLNSDQGWWGIKNIKIEMLLCDKSCKSCLNPNSCTSCQTSIVGLQMVGAFCQCTSSGTRKQLISQCTSMPCIRCNGVCSFGYYYDSIPSLCYPCNPACAQCIGPQNTNSSICIQCANGYFRTNSATQPCYNCIGGCFNCSALSITSCISCKQGYFLSGTQCLLLCPNGKYPVEFFRECRLCSLSCNTCNGINSSYCTSCLGSFFLTPTNQCLITCPIPYLKDLLTNKCVQECPMRTYIDTVSRTCINCNTNCLQCNLTSCLKCQKNYFLYLASGLCTLNCPITHFGSNSTLQCELCHSDCSKCFGSTSGSCIQCSDNNKILINNMCQTSCPNGTYSILCILCHSTCLQCTGPSLNQCLSCKSPNFLDLNTTKCLEVCETGSIVNKIDFTCFSCQDGMVGYYHQCVNCSSTCQTCYGTSFLQCRTCKIGTQFHVSTCLLSNQSNVISTIAQQMKLSKNLITFVLLIFLICGFFEIILVYKTPLLPTIEFIQILSYFYLLSVPFSQQVQRILLFFYKMNFSVLISISSFQVAQKIPAKVIFLQKYGYYAIDSIGLHLIMTTGLVIFYIFKKLKQNFKFFEQFFDKINPFIITYLYRLVILDQMFSMLIYLIYGNISSLLGIISFIILFLDILIIGLTFFWKIKPLNKKKKQFALFYFNEIKQRQDQVNNNIKKSQQNNNKSFLISCIFYAGKVPFIFALVYFIHNGLNQIISLLGYSIFFLLVISILPFKRRIYRFLYILGGLLLAITSGIFLGIIQNVDLSIFLELLWIFYFLIITFITVFQILINIRYFIEFFKYLKNKTQIAIQKLIEQTKEQEENQSNTQISQIKGKNQKFDEKTNKLEQKQHNQYSEKNQLNKINQKFQSNKNSSKIKFKNDQQQKEQNIDDNQSLSNKNYSDKIKISQVIKDEIPQKLLNKVVKQVHKTKQIKKSYNHKKDKEKQEINNRNNSYQQFDIDLDFDL